MKKYFSILIVTFLLASCNKWLDVKPESQVEQDELFETEAGFIESLNGVYARCVQGDVYGNELTFGFPDVLAQNYTIINDDKKYLRTSQYNYKDADFISRKDRAWKGLYNAIVNCNLILEHLNTGNKVLSASNFALVKGEALGLRAYLHLDILRLFGPSYTSNPAAKAIPYVTTFSNKVTAMSTVEEALTKITADLLEAKTLLKPVDPVLSAAYKIGYSSDTSAREEVLPDLFLHNRRHRMNYYAVCGTLARAYLCMNKNAEALANAQEVIFANKFPWTSTDDFIHADPTRKDRILYKELLFCWSIKEREIELASQFNNGIISLTIEPNAAATLYEVAGAGGEDNRYKQWFKQFNSVSGNYMELQKYLRDKSANRHYLVAPALRLSELYYIAAESTYDTDPAKALKYVDTVRFARGINQPLTAPDKNTFLDELLKDARKEWYGEGQIFYMYKRLNKNIIGQSGTIIPASNSIFVMPLPDDEIEFGNR
jgi:starch-binding outer membrane protein, SusD/RagB family